jgi:hypothetical protein
MPGKPPAPPGCGVREGHSRVETSNLGKHVNLSCVRRAGWERLFCALCNCVAERLPRSCLFVSLGQLCGDREGAGGAAAPHLISKVLHRCDGWGGEGISGAIEVEMPP